MSGQLCKTGNITISIIIIIIKTNWMRCFAQLEAEVKYHASMTAAYKTQTSCGKTDFIEILILLYLHAVVQVFLSVYHQ